MKLGCLPYLNVKPLVYPLEHGQLPKNWELVYEPPSMLAKLLQQREIAAAPVSSFATFMNPELWITPGICISSYGPVDTVLMVSKVEMQDVKTVALDTSSLSGANMLKILLEELYNLKPDFVRAAPYPSEMLKVADAALIIGNPAMLMQKDGLNIFDLGAAWFELTKLPAVFAVWAGPKDGLTPELIQTLESAKQIGRQKLNEISREQSIALGVPYDICYNYLARVMKYDLGEREIKSLKLFAQKAYEHGLVEVKPEVKVVGRD